MYKCPVCDGKISAFCSVAYTNGLDCPHCHTRLEVTSGSRMIPSALGLLAGWAAWELTKNCGGILGWALPVLYSVLAFGAVSSLLQMLMTRLEVAPQPPAQTTAPAAAHGHH